MVDPSDEIVVEWDIFPLFVVSGEAEADDPVEARAFLGTGFLIAPNLAVTCWHVVRDAVERDERIVAVGRDPLGNYRSANLEDLSPDSDGRDLATARVSLTPRHSWSLASNALPPGSDVLTFGYPLTDPPTEARPTFTLNSRYLQGYVTRNFFFEDPVFGTTPAYELDMHAPAGLSGAPLVRVGSSEIVGVVFGRHGFETIESFGLKDPETGRRDPEVVQVEHFALAHFTESLLQHRSAATGNTTLQDLLASG